MVQEDEPCGVCLRPSSRCRIFLGRSGTGHPNIDMKKTFGCGNMKALGFRYSIAMESTDSSPCSNVPLACPLCPAKTSPAVWRYNFTYHMRQAHPDANLSDFETIHSLSKFEIDFIDSIWEERLTIVSQQAGKSKASSNLLISEAHTSTHALARVECVFLYFRLHQG